MRARLSLLFFVLSFMVGGASNVSAQELPINLPDGSVFSLYPAKIEVALKPNEKVIKTIRVINTLGYDAVFNLSVEDLGPSNNINEPAVLYGDAEGPFTVRNLVGLPYQSITIRSGETKIVPVQISGPTVSDLGGRYGVVLFSVASGDDVGQSTKIISRLGATLLIKSSGNLVESGETVSFGVIGSKVRFYDAASPLSAQVTFKNNGNIHLNTYGAIVVKNIFGGEVMFAELDPWYVLPGAIRLREVSLGNKLRFGPYRLEASVNRGYDNQIDRLSAWVLVLPSPWISVVVMALLIGLTFWFFARKRFSQYA